MTQEQTVESLRAVERAGRWSLVGSGPGGVELVNDYLGYLADRGYSPRTVRAYAFDLLAFARWLVRSSPFWRGCEGPALFVSRCSMLSALQYCRHVNCWFQRCISVSYRDVMMYM